MYESQFTVTSAKAKQIAKNLKKDLGVKQTEAQKMVASMFGCKNFDALLYRTDRLSIQGQKKYKPVSEMCKDIIAVIPNPKSLSYPEFSLELEEAIHAYVPNLRHDMHEHIISSFKEPIPQMIGDDWRNRSGSYFLTFRVEEARGLLEVAVHRHLGIRQCTHWYGGENPFDQGSCQMCGKEYKVSPRSKKYEIKFRGKQSLDDDLGSVFAYCEEWSDQLADDEVGTLVTVDDWINLLGDDIDGLFMLVESGPVELNYFSCFGLYGYGPPQANIEALAKHALLSLNEIELSKVEGRDPGRVLAACFFLHLVKKCGFKSAEDMLLKMSLEERLAWQVGDDFGTGGRLHPIKGVFCTVCGDDYLDSHVCSENAVAEVVVGGEPKPACEAYMCLYGDGWVKKRR